MGILKKKEAFDVSKDDQVANQPTANNERGGWDSKAEFLLSILGYAVGFGNVWRFPYLCYKNGGAAFLIPYGIMLFCAGFPLFFLELVIGQYASLGPNVLFAKMAPIFTGLGYSMLMISLLITIYYNLIFAWVLFYTFASFTWVLPWSSCNNTFNSPNCFTQEASLACLKDGLVYFNKECRNSTVFCYEVEMEFLNATHCTGTDNETKAVNSVIKKISSSEDYYRNRVLRIEGKTWEDMGDMQWEIFGCLLLAWTIICLCMIKGVKSSGKVVYFTATFPYVVLVILFIRGVTLDGFYSGIEFYLLKPNMSKLYEIEVWNDAATQIFYSLGAAAGVLITLSSYNKFNNNCFRDAIVISICNCCTSVFAGFVIFSILGFMATELGVEVKDVVESGSGLAFVAYPEAVARMPFSPIWSLLFFTMLITLGIDSQFSYMETLATAIFDQYEFLRPKKALVTILITLVLFISGITMCLEGGVYMFELFVWYSSGLSLITVGLVEVVVVNYVFGYKKVMQMIEEMGIKIPVIIRGYLALMWLIITPGSLLLILILSIYYYVPVYYGQYVFPPNIQSLGWLLCAASIVCIPIGAIYVLCTNKKGVKGLFDSSALVPQHVRDQNEHNKETFNTYTYENKAYN